MYRKLDISEVNRMDTSNIKEWVNAYKARTNKTNADIAKQIGMTRRRFEEDSQELVSSIYQKR